MAKRSLLLLFIVLGLVSCDSQTNAPNSVADVPELNFMNNSDNGNLRITRFEEHFAACWSDATSGLRACHSTVPLGGGDETDCGPQELLDPVQVQDVGLLIDPEEFWTSWLHRNLTGRVWITVRDLNQPGACFDNRLVGEGWGQIRLVDNDLFGVGGPDRNANAWGFSAHGKLTSPAGEALVYSGHLHFRYNNSAGFRESPPKVSVR